MEAEAAARHPDQKPRLEFQAKALALRERFDSALKRATELDGKLTDAAAWLEKSPKSTADDRSALKKLRDQVRAALRLLRGDAALAARPMNLPDSARDRVFTILGDGRNSLAGPTATHRRLLEEADAEVTKAAAGLKAVEGPLDELRKRTGDPGA